MEERVLLHLAQFFYNAEDYESPRETSQEGIAEAVGVSFTHVPRAVESLRKKDLLTEHKMHTPGSDRKRKTYLLSHSGYQRADEIKDQLLNSEVLVKGERGLEPAVVSDLLGPSASNADLLTLLSRSRSIPVIEATEVGTLPKQPHPTHLAPQVGHIPRVREWVGRKEELKRLQTLLRHPQTRVVLVTGIAGIGKTTLTAKALEKHRDKTPLLWYRLREWDALRHMGMVVGEFLASLGRPDFKKYVESRTEYDLAEALRLLEEGLRGLEAVLVFDDFEKASRTVLPFVRDFVSHLEHLPGVTLVLVSRTRPPIVMEGDIASGKAQEVHVEGLDVRAARHLIKVRRAPSEWIERLWQVTNGHPLLLKLAESLPPQPSTDENAKDVLHATSLARFLQEEIVASLSPEERKVLELASVHRLPFPPHALFGDPTVRFDTLDRLRSRLLVRDVGGKSLEVVDFVREFVYARLTPEERKAYHGLAAQHYRPSADETASWEGLYHLVRGGAGDEAARLVLEKSPSAFERGHLEELNALLREFHPSGVAPHLWAHLLALRGDIFARWGTTSKAAQSYREALKLADEALAPAHRAQLSAADRTKLDGLRATLVDRAMLAEASTRGT